MILDLHFNLGEKQECLSTEMEGKKVKSVMMQVRSEVRR